MRYCSLLSITLFVLFFTAKAQIVTNKAFLQRQSVVLKQAGTDNRAKAYSLAREKHWPTQAISANKSISVLVGINKNNHPIYYTTFNNIDAAATINTSPIWPSGSTGLNLNGSSYYLKNKLGIWDGGRVLDTHIELVGRINRMDSSNYNGGGSDHATHVTGTMMATGINPLVKGMCYGLQGIITHDFTLNTSNDVAEVSAIASKLLLSNHSYGVNCGWVQQNYGWQFYGNYGDTIDYAFGYYDSDAAAYDNIAYNAPYYLQVRAAGNSRNQNGPRVGGSYYYYDSVSVKTYGIRPANISSNNSYQTIPTTNNAKNMVTVGAVYAITFGYSQPSDVITTPFSSWGPSNDGRIKPDLVADGVQVYSTFATNDSAYAYDNGTSMAAPAVTGSLLLLQEYYSKLHSGSFLRAATLKGLAIHTANEAGNAAGPDYKFGWGLMNTQGAAEVLKVSNATKNAVTSKHLLFENVLKNGETYAQNITATSSGTIKATISWTDPAGPVTVVDAKHPPVAELVNDLDMRITKSGNTYYPWVLNPYVPAADATTGDNYLDNVEQVIINNVNAGDIYTIKISHKGTLKNGYQAYSLLISQPGDTILPLNLLSFSASLKGEIVLLQWTTTNEVNTKYFVIESSTDGNNWQLLTTVDAKNTVSTNHYSFNLTATSGTTYYRLKIIDITGKYIYSSIQSIDVLDKSDLVTLSPNPASNYITLSFDTSIKQAVIKIINTSGKAIISKQISLSGSNTYTLPISQFSAGVYTVSVHANNTIITKKLVITK